MLTNYKINIGMNERKADLVLAMYSSKSDSSSKLSYEAGQTFQCVQHTKKHLTLKDSKSNVQFQVNRNHFKFVQEKEAAQSTGLSLASFTPPKVGYLSLSFEPLDNVSCQLNKNDFVLVVAELNQLYYKVKPIDKLGELQLVLKESVQLVDKLNQPVQPTKLNHKKTNSEGQLVQRQAQVKVGRRCDSFPKSAKVPNLSLNLSEDNFAFEWGSLLTPTTSSAPTSACPSDYVTSPSTTTEWKLQGVKCIGVRKYLDLDYYELEIQRGNQIDSAFRSLQQLQTFHLSLIDQFEELLGNDQQERILPYLPDTTSDSYNELEIYFSQLLQVPQLHQSHTWKDILEPNPTDSIFKNWDKLHALDRVKLVFNSDTYAIKLYNEKLTFERLNDLINEKINPKLTRSILPIPSNSSTSTENSGSTSGEIVDQFSLDLAIVNLSKDNKMYLKIC